jgi:hypothetical protein
VVPRAGLFLDLGTRMGCGVSVTPRPLYTPGKDPVPIVQEAGWVPGPVWTGAENLAPTGIRSPDLPARSQSLYRLSYPAHGFNNTIQQIYNRSTEYNMETLFKEYIQGDSGGICNTLGNESMCDSKQKKFIYTCVRFLTVTELRVFLIPVYALV